MTTGAPTEVGADQVERLLADLNPPQREAVTHGEGPLLVLAGAGSGKTRVLTYRIAWLMATRRARPGEILAITFTNKAAAEMRERAERLVGGVSRLMWVMTFHSACARILRREAKRLGYTSGFTIYDEADSIRMVKRCAGELELDPKRFVPRAVKSGISAAKNRLVDHESFAETAASPWEESVAEVYALYEKRMLAANAMDFDDLLVRTVNLLELFEEARNGWGDRFRWILVDEYQDTNYAQYRLLQLLAGERGNLTVVGDDQQAIYGFRGAEIRNILEFERDFRGTEVVKLEQNYRSTQNILSAANGVAAHNESQKPKHLWSEIEGGEPVRIAELSDEHEEARWVAGEIERLTVDEGASRPEIAVFYRTNAQSRVLEDTLVRHEMPYQVIGGTKFYERAEIKDTIAYLTLLVNPADEVCFGRVVNSPRRGIGDRSQARIRSHANTTGQTVWEVMGRVQEVPGLGAAAMRAIARFAEQMEGLKHLAGSASVAELLKATLERSGYLEALEAERTIEAEGRVENLQELVGVAAEFDANRAVEGESDATPLQEFLQQIALFTDQDSRRDSDDLVTLMTLHNAKGLEYETVFMIGCEEGVFPHSRSIDEGNLEEERRLCYVGITRAKRRIYMTCARRRSLFGAGQRNFPSRFLGEVPEELVEREAEAGASLTGWFGAGSGPLGDGRGRPQPRTELVAFQTGDDVEHASFGDGVVTAVEPGGVIAVRFASDGSERKLMADYAPLRKR